MRLCSMAKLGVMLITIFVLRSRARDVSCDFEHGLCGWDNGENTTLLWSLHYYALSRNSYMRLKMGTTEANNKGRLSSPWLNGSVYYRCQLQFRYYIGYDNTYQLSVFLRTETSFTPLWNTTDATSGFTLQKSPRINVSCAEPQYQLVFEGKKKRERPRNKLYRYSEIDIDDVEYEQTFIHAPSTTSTASFTTTPQLQSTQHQTSEVSSFRQQTEQHTLTPKLSSVDPDNPATATDTAFSSTTSGGNQAALSNTDNDTGFATGTLVAIIVTSIGAAVVVAIVVVFLMRRRRQTGPKTECRMFMFFNRIRSPKSTCTDNTAASKAVSNCGYISCDKHISGQNRTTDISANNRGDHSGSLHVYSTPDDKSYELASLQHSHGTPRQVSAGQDCSNLSSPRDVQSVSAVALSEHIYENAVTELPPVQHEYAMLHAERKRKQGGNDDYSLAHNVETPASAEAAAAYAVAGTMDYERADDDGRLVTSLSAPSGHLYNKLVTSSSAPSGDGCDTQITSPSSPSCDVYDRLDANERPAVGQDIHQNHYDHFNDPAGTGPEYSSLDHGDKAGDQQREMAASEYSHI